MPFNAQGRWVPEDQSAASKLTGMLASDSPYIKLARDNGMAVANRRGLLNSSIAAGTSEASAIAAAAPIAQQDASQIASQNLSYQGAGQASDLSSQEAGQTSALAAQQAAAARAAQSQSEQAARDMAAQQAGYASEEDARKAGYAADLSKQEAGQQLTYGTTVQGMQNANAQQTQASEAATSARSNALQAALAANQTYTSGFNALQANTDLPADTRAAYLQNLIDARNSQYDMIQQVYGIKLDWGQGSAAAAPATAPAPAAPTSSGGKSTTDKIVNTLVSPLGGSTGRSLVKTALTPGSLLKKFL